MSHQILYDSFPVSSPAMLCGLAKMAGDRVIWGYDERGHRRAHLSRGRVSFSNQGKNKKDLILSILELDKPENRFWAAFIFTLVWKAPAGFKASMLELLALQADNGSQPEAR